MNDGMLTLRRAYTTLGVTGPILLHPNLNLPRELAATDTWKAAAELLAESLEPYHVAVPAYTYSFCHGRPFDVKLSPAEDVGMFPEWYRTQSGNKRTQHGIFSHAGTGLPNVDNDAFGPGSYFGWLHRRNGTVLNVGCTMRQGGTFVHYIEQSTNVDYRYRKDFTGLVIDEQRNQSIQTYGSYVRDLDRGVETVLQPMEQRLLDTGRLNAVDIAGYRIMAGRAKDIYDGVREALDEDPYYLVRFAPGEAA